MSKASNPQDYVTPEAAAGIIGIEASGVRRYCRLGRLAALKLSRDWLILRADAERFKRPEMGRPANGKLEK